MSELIGIYLAILISATVWMWFFGRYAGPALTWLKEIADNLWIIHLDLEEVVQKLDEGNTMNLSKEANKRIEEWAARPFSEVPDDPGKAYAAGLQDGVTMLSQYISGESSEEPDGPAQ